MSAARVSFAASRANTRCGRSAPVLVDPVPVRLVALADRVSEHASMVLHDTAGAGPEMDRQLHTSHVGVWMVAAPGSGAAIAHEKLHHV